MNLQAAAKIAASAYIERRSQGSHWVLWFVFVVGAGLAGIPLLLNNDKNLWAFSGATFFGISFFNVVLLWGSFAANLARQCSPANLQLMPELRPLSFGIFLFAWMLASLVPALLLSACIGHFTLLWLATGSFLLVLTPSISTGRLVYLLPCLVLVYHFDKPDRLIALVHWLDDGIVGLSAIAALLLYAILTAKFLFHVGSDRAMKRQETLLNLQKWQRIGQRPAFSGKVDVFSGANWAYDRYLNRLLQFRTMRTSRRSGLFAMGLGRNAHWISVAHAIFLLLAFVAILAVFGLFGSPSRVMRGLGFAFAVNAVFQPMMAVFSYINALTATKNEQALLRLLPFAPTGKSLNRYVAKNGLFLFGLSLSVATLYIGATCWWLRQSSAAFIPEALQVLLPMLAASVCTMRYLLLPFAEIRQFSMSDVGPYGVLCILPLTVVFAPYDLVSPELPWAVLIATVIASAAFLPSAWKRAVNAPTALPVGRLAS